MVEKIDLQLYGSLKRECVQKIGHIDLYPVIVGISSYYLADRINKGECNNCIIIGIYICEISPQGNTFPPRVKMFTTENLIKTRKNSVEIGYSLTQSGGGNFTHHIYICNQTGKQKQQDQTTRTTLHQQQFGNQCGKGLL